MECSRYTCTQTHRFRRFEIWLDPIQAYDATIEPLHSSCNVQPQRISFQLASGYFARNSSIFSALIPKPISKTISFRIDSGTHQNRCEAHLVLEWFPGTYTPLDRLLNGFIETARVRSHDASMRSIISSLNSCFCFQHSAFATAFCGLWQN